ncbi:MAG TPA: CAP domain-containing protein, partial [Sphingomicrobium sp.]|nr:CAP domain-containing protein [Sphingomicrobium sp.]
MNSVRMFAGLVTTLLAASPTSALPAPQGATGELAQRLLDAHNRERAMVGAPPLQWDSTLAAHAASYGPVLASLRHLVHSP